MAAAWYAGRQRRASRAGARAETSSSRFLARPDSLRCPARSAGRGGPRIHTRNRAPGGTVGSVPCVASIVWRASRLQENTGWYVRSHTHRHRDWTAQQARPKREVAACKCPQKGSHALQTCKGRPPHAPQRAHDSQRSLLLSAPRDGCCEAAAARGGQRTAAPLRGDERSSVPQARDYSPQRGLGAGPNVREAQQPPGRGQGAGATARGGAERGQEKSQTPVRDTGPQVGGELCCASGRVVVRAAGATETGVLARQSFRAAVAPCKEQGGSCGGSACGCFVDVTGAIVYVWRGGRGLRRGPVEGRAPGPQAK